jgi:hypothetical protein
LLKTIQPILERLNKEGGESVCQVIVNALYHETEGCHLKDKAVEGMNGEEISAFFKDAVAKPADLQFEGFPNPKRGWYVMGHGTETRFEAEAQAASFMCGCVSTLTLSNTQMIWTFLTLVLRYWKKSTSANMIELVLEFVNEEEWPL